MHSLSVCWWPEALTLLPHIDFYYASMPSAARCGLYRLNLLRMHGIAQIVCSTKMRRNGRRLAKQSKVEKNVDEQAHAENRKQQMCVRQSCSCIYCVPCLCTGIEQLLPLLLVAIQPMAIVRLDIYSTQFIRSFP